jgi:Mg2+/Co2+ transporter CorB
MFLLIVSAGLVAASETAVTAASKARLYQLAKKGDKRAKKIVALQENMSTSISSILILNQLLIYLIPTLSALFLFEYLDTGKAAACQAVLGVFTLIYAEIFPKMAAIRFTIPLALFVGPALYRVTKILKPITLALEACARGTLKLTGVKDKKRDSSEQADEELRDTIEAHPSEGDEEEAQKKSMLKSILDLEEISVGHAMIHRKNLKTINASLPLEKIVEELTSCPFSRIPLWKDNPENIVGVLNVKTFFRALQLNKNDFEKIKITRLAFAPWFIPDTKRLLDQLQDFRKKREHFALVVDEYGDLQGCITLEDILEEIVGEIADEYDAAPVGAKLHADGSVVAEGSTPIRDLNREFDWNIPEDDAATIAGYVMREARKIPDVGQTYVLASFKIEILKRQRNQIGLLKITPPQQNADKLA